MTTRSATTGTLFATAVICAAVIASDKLAPHDPKFQQVAYAQPEAGFRLLLVDPTGRLPPRPIDPSALAAESPAHVVVTDAKSISDAKNLQAVIYADTLPPRPVPITIATRDDGTRTGEIEKQGPKQPNTPGERAYAATEPRRPQYVESPAN